MRTDSDMTEGSIWRHLIEFSIPMIIGLLFQQLYNTVDTLVVGNFVSKEAQAAVGSTGSIINTVVGFCAGLATGASVIISQRYGAHDQQGLRKAVHTTIAVTFILSVIATALGILIIEPMLRFMQTPDDVLADARLYLTIYFSGVAGILFYNMGSGILRAVGDSRRPLIFLIFSALLNTVLDLVFVLVFHMKVDGVAYATIISQIISAALILYTLTREPSAYGIRWKELRIDMQSFRNILRIGLPSSIQSAITSFSNVFVQSYINAFGSACMAGYSIYNKLDAFVLIPVQAIAMSSTTMVGQNWGAGQKNRARDSVRKAIYLSLISTAVLSVIAYAAARELLGLFSPEPDVISYGIRFIHIVTPFYLTICFNQIYAGALRGIGDATAPTVIMLCSFVVFRQIYLAVTKAMNIGFVSVALAYPMGWIMCSVLLFIRYRRSALFQNKPDAPAVQTES
ncbi:MAG: MATE family efflux transporter [Clostridiales bacterium]|nr:MATE family efflux transporter [Clostridiales bacterium]